MSINFSSNFIPKDSDSISNNPKEGQNDILVEDLKTKVQLIYERFEQHKLESRERYARLTPSEKVEEDMRLTISLKRMNNYPLSEEELRWHATKRKK